MTTSARGTVDKPGRNVAQKRGLNRRIPEACRGKRDQYLSYKLSCVHKTHPA